MTGGLWEEMWLLELEAKENLFLGGPKRLAGLLCRWGTLSPRSPRQWQRVKREGLGPFCLGSHKKKGGPGEDAEAAGKEDGVTGTSPPSGWKYQLVNRRSTERKPYVLHQK